MSKARRLSTLTINPQIGFPLSLWQTIHYPSSTYSRSRRGQQLKLGDPDVPSSSHLDQLHRRNPKAFPRHLRNTVPPACSETASGPPPRGFCREHLAVRCASRLFLLLFDILFSPHLWLQVLAREPKERDHRYN